MGGGPRGRASRRECKHNTHVMTVEVKRFTVTIYSNTQDRNQKKNTLVDY